MSQNGKTPGQATYEAWEARRFPDGDTADWPRLGDDACDAWEAAAQAAIDTARAALGAAERDMIRADLGEMLDVLGLGDYARPESPHEVFAQCIAKVRDLRDLVAELRAILLQGGQNAGDVRRWAIAALDRAGMIGDGK